MVPSPPDSEPASASPLLNRLLLIVAVLVAICFVFWFSAIRPHQQGMRGYHQIERAILKLATKCPPDVSRGRWAHYIAWTWQLHGNFGPHWYWDRDERERFIEEFEQRVDGRVHVETIDWIWDQYMEHTTRGQGYDKYRPTLPENLKEVDAHSYKTDPLQEWIERYESEQWNR